MSPVTAVRRASRAVAQSMTWGEALSDLDLESRATVTGGLVTCSECGEAFAPWRMMDTGECIECAQAAFDRTMNRAELGKNLTPAV